MPQNSVHDLQKFKIYSTLEDPSKSLKLTFLCWRAVQTIPKKLLSRTFIKLKHLLLARKSSGAFPNFGKTQDLVPSSSPRTDIGKRKGWVLNIMSRPVQRLPTFDIVRYHR